MNIKNVYKTENSFVIGVDFGTDSVRAVVLNAFDGKVMATSVHNYKRWNKGRFCNPTANQFRQHPLDYIESMESVIKNCVNKLEANVRERVLCISVATTGSTPAPVNREGIPLALLEGFEENPNAMFILWKDHTATKEADEINRLSDEHSQFLKYVGGKYSSEWYWSKLLHILRTDKEVKKHCYSMVEHSDWIPFLLTSGKDVSEIKRNVCAAGHKGLWVEELGGLPDRNFFEDLDPVLIPFAERFGNRVYAADQSSGRLSKEWAERFGLSENVQVGVGALDAHMGAVGGGIKPFYVSKVIGTSTCDMMIVPKKGFEGVFVEGIAGQVDGSIIPGMIGLEAGQSAFGDIYSWFRELLLWPLINGQEEHSIEPNLINNLRSSLLQKLDEEAYSLPLEENAEFALDWFNGRRTPNANPNLSGCIGGLTLGSSPSQIYRALVESTCFGARAIIEGIEKQGINVLGINALGGIAVKSKYVIQTLSDALNRPVNINTEAQPVALGAAMFAAVVAGIYPNVLEASERMRTADIQIIYPRKEFVELYNRKFEEYLLNGRFQEQLIGQKR